MDDPNRTPDGPRFYPKRRFGLPADSLPPTITSPLQSPTKISLEEYEKEGREETRKELAALFSRLENNPGLTKHLPHVTKAMKENGKSSAQTERLRALRKNRKPTPRYGVYLFLIVAVLGIAIGAWYQLNKRFELLSLPHAAHGSPSQLMSALQACTKDPSLYGLSDRREKPTEGQKLGIDVACVNLSLPMVRKSALYLAAQTGILENVLMLLELGGDVQASDIFGMRPLHVASGHSTISALLKAGADRYAVDSYGKTALYYLRTESELKAYLDGQKELFWHRDGSGMSALHDALWRCLVADSHAVFELTMQKVKSLIAHIPSGTASYLATMKDAGGKTPLLQALELATLQDSERRLRSTDALAHMLVKLAKEADQDARDIVRSLDVVSELVKADALGTLTFLFSNEHIPSSLVSASQLDSHGRYPIAYVKSSHVLDLLQTHGAVLHPLEGDKPLAHEKDPLHHILASLSLHHASIAKQFHLLKALIAIDDTFENWLPSVSMEIKSAIERRFVLVNAEPVEWSVQALILGFELLSEPTHHHYLKLVLMPQDQTEMPLLLAPKSSAQFDVQIGAFESEMAGVIDIEASSNVDSINLQVTPGASLQTFSSPNSFFGSMPRIRLPVDRRSANSTDRSFKILLHCSNYFSWCAINFHIKTDPVGQHHLTAFPPIVHTHFKAGWNLFALARAAALLWLPISMLPKSVPMLVRFSPFFVSLSGVVTAGPLFLLYWLGYTTISHLVVRLVGM